MGSERPCRTRRREVSVRSRVARPRADPGYLTVGGIEDDILAHAVPCRDLALPPGEHGPALVVLHLEVSRGPVLAKPHELSLVIHYHRAVLPVTLLQGGKDVSGGSVAVRFRSSHLDGGRTKLWARMKSPYALFRRGCDAWQRQDPSGTQRVSRLRC